MSILSEQQKFGPYTIQTFIKKGMYDETYIMADAEGKRFFLKLFVPAEIPAEAKDAEGNILEIAYSKRIAHPSVISQVDSGMMTIDDVAYPYYLTPFVDGELMETHLLWGKRCTVKETTQVAYDLLAALSHIHGTGLMHCDITPRSVIITNAADEMHGVLIDLGHLCEHPMHNATFLLSDLSPWYRAPETFRGIFTPESDVFSVAAVLYSMLYGAAPWEKDTLAQDDDEKTVRSKVHIARKAPLAFDGRDDVPQWLQEVLAYALQVKKEDRMPTADLFMEMLAKEGKVDAPKTPKNDTPSQKGDQGDGGKQDGGRDERGQISTTSEFKVAQGNGFADVAGMDDLKMRLQQRVLFVLKNKKKAEAYKLTPPNGMLLYGPPGCGKTYFAQKFAEESGFKFCMVKASDLGSIYIHGSQTMIADLFKKAEANAPAVICLDEFDAIAPKRGTRGLENTAGEVNEILSQLNECGKRGIFVIGTTNRPSLIDSAVLRKGRLDIIEYVPAPDKTTRKLMFDLYLKDRPCDEIDTELLSEKTENYVASDIAYIVNDAALISALRDELITQETVVNCIRNTRPSLNAKIIDEYKRMNEEFEGEAVKANPVGFSAILAKDKS